MQKITVSYQEYDQLCQKVSELKCRLSRLPTKKEIEEISSYMTGYFFSILTWLVENENGIPETEEGDALREYVNDRIDEGIEHYMSFQNDIENPIEKWKINLNDYLKAYEIAEKLDFLEIKDFPNVKQANECIKPLVKYHFGFILVLLLRHKDIENSVEYQNLKQLLEDNFDLVSDKKRIKMSMEEYEQLCQSVENCYVKRKRWWPTEEEINDIIIPNLELCYDFVVWILETGPDPVKPKEKKSMKILQEIIRENTDFSEEKKIPWISNL